MWSFQDIFIEKISFFQLFCYYQINENESYVVQEYKFDNPLFTHKDSIKDDCFKDCHNNYFRNFLYECMYDNTVTNITDNEIFNLTISGKSMNLYESNKKLKVAKQNGSIFNQTN